MANTTYKYKRYMRDGSVQERTGTIRSRTKKEKNNGSKESSRKAN